MKENFVGNLITYAYRGLFSVIYFVFGKKEKINEMFLLDKEEMINLDTNNSFIKRKEGKFSNPNEHIKQQTKLERKLMEHLKLIILNRQRNT